MEIERKFLVKEMPDISGVNPVPYERYYLRVEDGLEERIQRKGGVYEREIKRVVKGMGNVVQRTSEKTPITQEEFETLKQGKEGISRDSYRVSSKPDISLKVYHGKFEGLVRAEIEFENETEAKQYEPVDWMGNEISQSPLGLDSRLLHLSREEFLSLLKRESE